MAKVVRRNANRQIAALQRSHTQVTVYAHEDHYVARRVHDGEHAWAQWARSQNARATLEDDGTLTISLHGRRWYELRQPE